MHYLHVILASAIILFSAAKDNLSNLNTVPSNDIDVTDLGYGARCDGSADDSSAINAAIEDFRKALDAGRVARLVINHSCTIRSSINLTGIKSYLGTVDMTGGSIVCSTSGAPCIDAVDTDHISWLDVKIIGTATNRPSIGIQIARRTADLNSDCGEQRFDRLKTLGYFTFTSFYSGSCETMFFGSPHFENRDEDASFALVLDGQNHWKIKSSFVSMTDKSDIESSFDENVFLNATIVGKGKAAPVWTAGAEKHRFIGSYLLAVGSEYGIISFDSGVMSSTMNEYDIHIEGTRMTDAFLFTGNNPRPTLFGFKYFDHQSQATKSYFKLDRGVDEAIMLDGEIHITQPGRSNVQLFAAPSQWEVRGHVQVGSNSPSRAEQLASFFGQWCVGTKCVSAEVPSAPIIRP